MRHNRKLRAPNSGPALFVDWPVLDLAALAALGAPDDGNTAWVQSLDAVFSADTTSSLVPDGVTVVAAAGGGNWVRRLTPSLKWQRQAAWFISVATGSDENDGATDTTPLQSWAEFRRRVGEGNFEQDVLVTILDGDTDLDLNGLFVCQGVAALTVQGRATTTRSGTLTGATSIAAATNQAQEITDALVDWTTDVGSRIRLTANNAVAWVAMVLGVTTDARTSPFHTQGINSVTLFSPVGDEDYVIESLPTVGAISLRVQRGQWNLAPTGPNPLIVRDVAMRGALQTLSVSGSDLVALINCDFDGQFLQTDGTQLMLGCRVDINAFRGGRCSLKACLVPAAVSAVNFETALSQHTLFQGGGISASGHVTLEVDGAAFFDVAGVAFKLTPSGRGSIDNGSLLWGSGNGTACAIESGSKLVYNATKPVITGTTEVNLGDGADTFNWAGAPPSAPRFYSARNVGVLDEQADATVV